MELKTNFVTNGIAKKDGQNHLVLEVCPSKTKEKISKPNAWVFVVDKSGSMNSCLRAETVYCYGSQTTFVTTTNNLFNDYSTNIERKTKMDYAKSSMITFLNQLKDDDKVGVVEFASYANVVEELRVIKEKSTLINKINLMQPNGCTNIDAGINLGKSLFSSKDLENYNCKIILISDGETNEGRVSINELSNMTLEFLKTGITTSCIGIGDSYNSQLLDSMATNGGGYLYHVDDLSKLQTFFEQELELSNNILAKSVELIVSCPTYLEIEKNLNNYHEETEDEKKIFIGDITGNRKVVIGIKNDFRTNDATFKITCKYKTPDNEKCTISTEKTLPVLDDVSELEKNKELLDYVMGLLKSNTMSSAMLFAEQRNSAAINTVFSQSIVATTDVLRKYNASEDYASATIDSFASSHTTCSNAVSNATTSEIKNMYSVEKNSTRN